MAYPSSLAEGVGAQKSSGGGDGSILEEYLDQIVVLPVEVSLLLLYFHLLKMWKDEVIVKINLKMWQIKRYITLIRELDESCDSESARITELQDDVLRAFKEELKKNPQWKLAEKKKRLEELRQAGSLSALTQLRKRLYQKIDEKISISEQLFGMSKQNLRAVTTKKNELEVLLRATGQLKEQKKRRTTPSRVGRLVAACITPSKAAADAQDSEELWILCKVKDWNDKGKVLVSDADNPNQKYTLRSSNVVLLTGKWNASEVARFFLRCCA